MVCHAFQKNCMNTKDKYSLLKQSVCNLLKTGNAFLMRIELEYLKPPFHSRSDALWLL